MTDISVVREVVQAYRDAVRETYLSPTHEQELCERLVYETAIHIERAYNETYSAHPIRRGIPSTTAHEIVLKARMYEDAEHLISQGVDEEDAREVLFSMAETYMFAVGRLFRMLPRISDEEAIDAALDATYMVPINPHNSR